MKIAANPLPFLDTAPAANPAANNIDYGRDFESTIRDVADTSAQVKARDDRQSSRQNQDSYAPSADNAPHKPSADKVSDTKAPKSKDSEEEKAAKDADAKDDAASGDPVADLGRLLGGTAVTALSAAKAVDADAKADPRVTVVSLEAGTAAEAAEDATATGARGKVKLEVVHMETHFEPRSDSFVLVDGSEANGMVVGAGGEGAPLSFNQALARLSQNKAVKTAAIVEDGKVLDVAAAADVAVAHEVTTQERAKDRVRSKVSADVAAKTADQANADVETQGAAAARKKDATDSTLDKISAKLGRAASDAADARTSTASPATKDGSAALPLASMTTQVADRVVDALGATLVGQQPSSVPSEAYLKMTAGGAALKTLTIQLQPETLGKLDVSMRLVDGQLTLEIAATEAATAKALAQDREGLRKLLQHAGFAVDDTSITIVTRDNSSQPQVRAAAASDASSSQQDAGNNGRSGDQGAEPQSRRQGSNQEENARSNDSRRKARTSNNYL